VTLWCLHSAFHTVLSLTLSMVLTLSSPSPKKSAFLCVTPCPCDFVVPAFCIFILRSQHLCNLKSSFTLQSISKKRFSPTRSSVAGAALCLHSVVIYPESRGTVTAFCIHPALSILPISKVPSLFNRSPKKRFFSAALCCHSVSAVKCISN
jgi:hypothetical protein